MATTRKNNSKTPKAAAHKKGGKAAASVPPDSDTTTPVDPAVLQNQIAERNNALELQERHISKLMAQVAALQPGGEANSTPPVATTGNSHIDPVESNQEDEEIDIAITTGVGLAPRTNSNVPSGFSRRANQRTITTVHAPALAAPFPVAPALIPAPAPAPAVAPMPAPAAPVIPVVTVPAPGTATHAQAALGAAPSVPASVTVAPVPAAPAAPLVPIAPAAAPIVPAGGKIRHPGGRVGRGCQLRQAMRLTNNDDLYKEIHRSVLRMFMLAHLPIEVYWKDQDQHKILAISTAVIKAFPYLKNFQPPSWPVLEMLKIMLRNKRGYRKKTSTSTEGQHTNILDEGIDEGIDEAVSA